jgi:hypothetical protein
LLLRRRAAGNRKIDLAEPFFVRACGCVIEQDHHRRGEQESCDPRAYHGDNLQPGSRHASQTAIDVSNSFMVSALMIK